MAENAIRKLASTAMFMLLVVVSASGCSRDANSAAEKTAGNTSPPAENELIVYGQVPPFEFTDQDGKAFSSSSLDGQVYLATFFFTTCPTTCPQQSRELSRFQDMDGLKLVSITVQPNVDTPEVLKRYAGQYQADLTKWSFLTGPRDEIWSLSQKGFMLGVGDAPEPGDLPIFHSSKIILIDREQRIRGYYESQLREEMVKLKKDAQRLQQEPTSGAPTLRPEESEQDKSQEDLSALSKDLQGAYEGPGLEQPSVVTPTE